MLLGKGKQIIIFSAINCIQIGVFELELKSEIRKLEKNKTNTLLVIITLSEIISCSIEKIKNAITKHEQKKINNINNTLNDNAKSWFKKLWSQF